MYDVALLEPNLLSAKIHKRSVQVLTKNLDDVIECYK